jgi:hypothetical protein
MIGGKGKGYSNCRPQLSLGKRPSATVIKNSGRGRGRCSASLLYGEVTFWLRNLPVYITRRFTNEKLKWASLLQRTHHSSGTVVQIYPIWWLRANLCRVEYSICVVPKSNLKMSTLYRVARKKIKFLKNNGVNERLSGYEWNPELNKYFCTHT